MENLNVNPGTHLPQFEKHARPLTKLEPEVQREVWKEITETHQPEEITAKVVEQSVNGASSLNDAVREVKANPMFYPANSEIEVIENVKNVPIGTVLPQTEFYGAKNND